MQTKVRNQHSKKFEHTLREEKTSAQIVQFFDKLSGTTPRVPKAAKTHLNLSKPFRQRLNKLAMQAIDQNTHPLQVDLDAIGLKEFTGGCDCRRGQCSNCPCTKSRKFCTSNCRCHPEKCQNIILQIEETQKEKVRQQRQQQIQKESLARKQKTQRDAQQTETEEEQDFFNTETRENRTTSMATPAKRQKPAQNWDRKKRERTQNSLTETSEPEDSSDEELRSLLREWLPRKGPKNRNTNTTEEPNTSAHHSNLPPTHLRNAQSQSDHEMPDTDNRAHTNT